MYYTVGRALDHEPDAPALNAGIAEQVELSGHKVVERNPQVLTGG